MTNIGELGRTDGIQLTNTDITRLKIGFWCPQPLGGIRQTSQILWLYVERILRKNGVCFKNLGSWVPLSGVDPWNSLAGHGMSPYQI